MRRAIGIFALLVIMSLIPLTGHGRSAAPVVTIIEPDEGEFRPPGNVTLNWTAEFDQTELDHFEVRINDGNWTDVGVNSTLKITDTISGNNTVTVRAYDNVSFGEANVSFFIDDVAPVIEITSPLKDSLLNTSALNVTWNIIEEGSGIQMTRIRVHERQWMFVNDTDFKVFQILSDGPNSVFIETIDMVGNIGRKAVNFSIDTKLPSVHEFGPLGTDIERDEIIYMDLEEGDIDPSSLEFNITPGVEGNLTVTDLRIEFVPDELLVPGTEYTVSVNFSDHAGNRAGPYEWKFRIADHYLRGKVNGYVVDSYGEYVQGALVTVGNITTFTDIFGSFEMEIMPGDHLITIEKENYTAYEGNFTLLPTQDIDLGKLEMEGGTPLDLKDDVDRSWMLYLFIAVLIVGLGIGIIASRKSSGGKGREAEE